MQHLEHLLERGDALLRMLRFVAHQDDRECVTEDLGEALREERRGEEMRIGDDENVLRVPGADEAIDFFERMAASDDRPL